MPKLWDQTIEAHRNQVRDAILEAAARLAYEHGPLAVTMSQVAHQAGIGRATLYRYFSGVEEILRAWHDLRISRHLASLVTIAGRDEPAAVRLRNILETLVEIEHQRSGHGAQPHGPELGAMLHRADDLAPAEEQLHALVQDVVADAAREGQVRTDVAPADLVTFCLRALGAAGAAPSPVATRELVGLILDGLRGRPARPS